MEYSLTVCQKLVVKIFNKTSLFIFVLSKKVQNLQNLNPSLNSTAILAEIIDMIIIS